MTCTITDGLINRFRNVIPIEEIYLKDFLAKFSLKSLAKGEFFLREGQVCKYLGFILKGSMVCTYPNDGDEIIEDFSFDNEFITDYTSFLTGSPSQKEVKCLEDSQLLVLLYDDLQALYAQNPAFERAGRIIAENLYLTWQQKAKSLMMDDAEKRYRDLLVKEPDLVQRVPQYLLASYLNIKPETLSRIRNRISGK